MEKSFSLYFHLKKTKNERKLERLIYFKLTVNGKFCEVSTKRKCEPSKWNVTAGRVEGKTEAAKSVNSYLDVLHEKYMITGNNFLVMIDHPQPRTLKCCSRVRR